jgi:hypothetical protein
VYWAHVKCGAEVRNLELSVTIEEGWEILVAQGHKCALSGVPICFTRSVGRGHTASLDRIRSDEGYVKGNVQWVHKDINQMKMDLPEDQFISWCHKVAEQNPIEAKCGQTEAATAA